MLRSRNLADPSGETSESGHASRLRVCLAGSGGGHLRQILDLSQAWSAHDYFIVTEDTALGRSVAAEHPTRFVTHVALGQARLGSPVRMLLSAARNFLESVSIVLKERPQVVFSTGAGSCFFTVLVARLLGARIVVADSIARFDSLSAFARMAGPLAHNRIVQSRALSAFWPDAEVFDPIRIVDGTRPPKKPLLFATVGATLPFDRLVETVAELKAAGEIPERVVIQTGIGGKQPSGVEVFETLPFDEMIAFQREADIVVCHGGSGSLITALREGCRVVAMPRLFSLGEHYDNHQEEITDAFRTRGLIRTARSKEELLEALQDVRRSDPVLATSEPTALTEFLSQLLQEEARRRA